MHRLDFAVADEALILRLTRPSLATAGAMPSRQVLVVSNNGDRRHAKLTGKVDSVRVLSASRNSCPTSGDPNASEEA